MSTTPLPGRRFDFVAMGELMIDFTCVGASDAGMLLYERNPGGAPMNVAAQVARLGGEVGVISAVGDDEHGEFLRQTVENLGIDVSNVTVSRTLGTRCIFVYLNDGNDRCFTNYRGTRPDLEIDPDSIDYSQVAAAKAIYFSPLANTYTKPIFEARRRALKVAEESGALVVYDPNYRFPYEDQRLRQLDIEAILGADILKMTAEEFSYYLGEDDIMRGSENLLKGRARLVAVSMGKDGCFLRSRSGCAYKPTFDVPVVDTTGAGDSFIGAIAYQATRPGVRLDSLSSEELHGMAEFANACASASTMHRGSLTVMPDRAEAYRIMRTVSYLDSSHIRLSPPPA